MRNPFAPLLRRSARRRAFTDMLKLDDHLLRDIGLTRAEALQARTWSGRTIHE